MKSVTIGGSPEPKRLKTSPSSTKTIGGSLNLTSSLINSVQSESGVNKGTDNSASSSNLTRFEDDELNLHSIRPWLLLSNDQKVPVEEDFCYTKGSHIIHSTSLPSKPDNNMRWIERVASYFTPTASFTFEVHYPNPKITNIGFTWQWQYLPYSLSSPKSILICVVKSVSDAFNHAIAVGDIILKLNEEILVHKPGDAVDPKRISKKLENFRELAVPSTVRVLRPCSGCANNLPSVAEILLLIQEKSVGAKFQIRTLNKDDPNHVQVELSHTDAQYPNSVKKVLSGQKFVWQQVPVLNAGAAQANATVGSIPVPSTTGSNSTTPLSFNFISPTFNMNSSLLVDVLNPNIPLVKTGIYKDRSKYVVFYVDNSNKALPKSYYLGRFESEDEANKTLQKALKSVDLNGAFSMKMFLLGLESQAIQESKATVKKSESSGALSLTLLNSANSDVSVP